MATERQSETQTKSMGSDKLACNLLAIRHVSMYNPKRRFGGELSNLVFLRAVSNPYDSNKIILRGAQGAGTNDLPNIALLGTTVVGWFS
jgi:hypothetical protein